MANIENLPSDNSKSSWDLLSEESRELLARQGRLQKDRVQAIIDKDEARRRLIEQELDEIVEKLS